MYGTASTAFGVALGVLAPTSNKKPSQVNTQSAAKTAAKNCTNTITCFTAGTLIHTIHGLKPIESIKHGDLIWSRQEFGTGYGYRPVIATKITPNQEVYEVVVRHSNNTTEIFKTTSEHPFWVEGIGWLKASLLEAGMTLLDKHGFANATIVSQNKLNHTETVYNFEVQDFHTYHIGEYGVWVHNADCCELKYEAAPYHGSVSNAIKSKAPTNPQKTLNESIKIKDTSDRRIAVDKSTGEFVIFDKTIDNIYHGHVRTWNELTQEMKNLLINKGLVNRKGKIL